MPPRPRRPRRRVPSPWRFLLSSRTCLAPVTLAARADEAGGPPFKVLRDLGQPPPGRPTPAALLALGRRTRRRVHAARRAARTLSPARCPPTTTPPTPPATACPNANPAQLITAPSPRPTPFRDPTQTAPARPLHTNPRTPHPAPTITGLLHDPG